MEITIGDIQRHHASELYTLLTRVLQLLESKSWDTRVAASAAIGAISAAVPQWSPLPGQAEIPSEDGGMLRFSQFDAASVVARGGMLVASAGLEFDADFSNLEPKVCTFFTFSMKGLSSLFLSTRYHFSFLSTNRFIL